jgi:hypothetical protein
VRGDKLNDSRFGARMRGEGPIAENIKNLFEVFRKKYQMDQRFYELSTSSFRRPGDQLEFLV